MKALRWSALALLCAITLVACNDDPPFDNTGSLDTGTDTDTDTDTDTGPAVDCSQVPDLPIAITEMDAPRGYHGLAFDDQGFIYGATEGNLLKTAYDGTQSVFFPNVNGADGMVFSTEGDLLVVLSDSITKIDDAGLDTFLVDAPGAYGITMGPDGLAYVAGGDEIFRVDPETGTKEILFDKDQANVEWDHRVVNFSLDNSIMYIATRTSASPEDAGDVYAMDLDSDLMPTSEPYLFAQNAGGGWHDSLGVDACGNLYVAEYGTRSLYRISPQGEVSLYIDWHENGGSEAYGHGLAWGSGIGGWKRDAIYMPQPYDDDTVVEVEIGVPSK